MVLHLKEEEHSDLFDLSEAYTGDALATIQETTVPYIPTQTSHRYTSLEEGVSEKQLYPR